MTSQLKVAFIRKLRGSLMCLDNFFDMLSLDVCITRHWQTSGRLVQELHACTVDHSIWLRDDPDSQSASVYKEKVSAFDICKNLKWSYTCIHILTP